MKVDFFHIIIIFYYACKKKVQSLRINVFLCMEAICNTKHWSELMISRYQPPQPPALPFYSISVHGMAEDYVNERIPHVHTVSDEYLGSCLKTGQHFVFVIYYCP